LPGGRSNTGGEHGDLLQLGRQRPDEIDAWHGTQFADLLEADFRLAAGDDGGNRFALDHPALRLDLIGDAETPEQLGRHVDAAGAVGIGDRSRVEQCALERVDRADLRLGRARADHHADTGARKLDAAVGQRLALPDQVAERLVGHDQDVGRLATLKADRDRRWCSPHRRSEDRDGVVAARALELWGELPISRRKAAGNHHVDLGRSGHGR
jgi:hypothetical protein